jgi:hypothetical protein
MRQLTSKVTSACPVAACAGATPKAESNKSSLHAAVVHMHALDGCRTRKYTAAMQQLQLSVLSGSQ